jgi:hypothetical protein
VSAKLVCVTACGRAGNPTRLTRTSRQSAVETHAALCDHKRPPSNNPFVESLVKSRAVVGQDGIAYFDARISKLRNASPTVTRICVHRADNNVLYTGPDDRGRAGGRATNRGTGFQSNVERGASGHVGGKVAEALDLSMFMACSSMVAPCHNPIVNRKDRTDGRIGTRLSLCFFRFVQRGTHKPLVSLCPHRHDKSIVAHARSGNTIVNRARRIIGARSSSTHRSTLIRSAQNRSGRCDFNSAEGRTRQTAQNYCFLNTSFSGKKAVNAKFAAFSFF